MCGGMASSERSAKRAKMSKLAAGLRPELVFRELEIDQAFQSHDAGRCVSEGERPNSGRQRFARVV